MASLNVIATKEFGWRGAFDLMGYLGIGVGLAGLLLFGDSPIESNNQIKEGVENEEETEQEPFWEKI